MVKDSFLSCAITTATDGSDDGYIHCFKPGQPCADGKKVLDDETKKLLVAAAELNDDDDPCADDCDEEETNNNEALVEDMHEDEEEGCSEMSNED